MSLESTLLFDGKLFFLVYLVPNLPTTRFDQYSKIKCTNTQIVKKRYIYTQCIYKRTNLAYMCV